MASPPPQAGSSPIAPHPPSPRQTPPPPLPVSLTDLDTDPLNGFNEEWYFPARPIFLRSNAYQIFRRELRRYVEGEVTGRSFLIAGHRGAGKTALVLRAVDDLQREIINREIRKYPRAAPIYPRGAPAPLAVPSRLLSPQRPFLVKLHGASLVSALPAPAEQDGWKTPGIVSSNGNQSAEQALQQITVALYRALAREVAGAFALHARQIDYGPPSGMGRRLDLPELAGHVTLELDKAFDLAGLRAAWQLLGKLGTGVLWPGNVGEALAAGGLRDRGVREVLALATANQAYQVCIGDIQDKQTRKDGATREDSIKAEAKADARDFANRLWGLTAGGLVGAATLSTLGPPAAVAAGLGTALVSTLALNWSSTRTRRSERGMDYTFIPDRSMKTLERELPLVIERIREAGLAPVFVVDELDKVRHESDAIDALIGRLKNLTTDYGFFCFLTGREYFEKIEQKVRDEAYPNEHTYFSHRLLVLYRPDELSAFVHELWNAPGNETVEGILTTYVLHRARLSTIDVMREIATLCDDRGMLRLTADYVRSSNRFLVPMAVQLAIEHVLRKPDLRPRMEIDPAFAQRAIDAMYMISRGWRESETILIDRDTLRDYLIRQGRVEGDTDKDKRQTLEKMLSEEDLKRLLDNVIALAELLKSFPAIQAAVTLELARAATATTPGEPALSAEERARLEPLSRLLSGKLGNSEGLVVRDDPIVPVYRFLFDSNGLEREIVAQMASAGEAAGVAQNQASALDLIDDLNGALSAFGLTLGQLVDTGVLPENVVESRIASAALALRAQATGAPPAHPEDISIVLGFAQMARTWSRAIAAFVALVDLIRTDADRVSLANTAAGPVLAVLKRMIPVARIAGRLAGTADPTASVAPASTQPPIPGEPAALLLPPEPFTTGVAFLADRRWGDCVSSERQRLSERLGQTGFLDATNFNEIWTPWNARFRDWFAEPPRPPMPPVLYADLVLAAAGHMPISLLKPDLNQMSAADWSRFADVAFNRPESAPPWTVAAALRALGFGRQVLAGLVADEDVVETARTSPPGVLFRSRRANSITEIPQNGPRSGRPVFVLPWSSDESRTTLIAWLRDHDAISGEVVEDEQEVPLTA